MTKATFTGLLDAKGREIHEGDLIWVGMRRGDVRGWTIERVAWEPGGGWVLEDPKTGERMGMQTDPMLRGLINPDTSEGK